MNEANAPRGPDLRGDRHAWARASPPRASIATSSMFSPPRSELELGNAASVRCRAGRYPALACHQRSRMGAGRRGGARARRLCARQYGRCSPTGVGVRRTRYRDGQLFERSGLRWSPKKALSRERHDVSFERIWDQQEGCGAGHRRELLGRHLIVRTAAFFSPYDQHNFAAPACLRVRSGETL
jgi:hypothetical protein